MESGLVPVPSALVVRILAVRSQAVGHTADGPAALSLAEGCSPE